MTVSVEPMSVDARAQEPAEALRPHAEDAFADELAALAAPGRPPAPGPLAAVAVGGGDLPARRHAADGTVITPKYVGPAPHRRGRRRHAGHRPRAAAARRARHRQDLGVRAPGGGDQRRLDAARAGHGRHPRGGDPLRLELRPAARRRPQPRRARAQPGDAGDGRGHDRPGRGADPHPGRRAGHADHDPVGEDAADPGAGPGGAGGPRVQPDRHRQRPRPGGQRAVQRAAPPVQHRRAAAAGHAPTRRSTSSPAASTRSGRSLDLPAVPAGSTRSAASSRSSASCATA